MAVTTAKTKLTLRIKTIIPDEKDGKIKTTSFSDIAEGASNEQIYLAGTALGSLQAYPIESISRLEEAVLTDED